jgi:capsular polysaccharide biosynthesis protein
VSSSGRGIFLAALTDLRRRWLLVATLGAVAAGVAAGFSFTAAKRYQATAVFVVAPVSSSDATLLGIDVLHDTNKQTAAATAAHLVAAPQVAEAVRVRLGLRSSREEILRAVSARADSHGDAVDVIATAADPARAAQLANGFVAEFIAARTAGFQSELVSALRRLQATLVALPPNRRLSPEGARIQQRVADVRALIGTSDPTIRHGSEAVAPSSASWPKPIRWTISGGLIGLGAGCLLALALGAVAAARREVPVGTSEYDPRVPERIVARLEQRLAKRVDELAAERERLAGREAGLAVREREITEKLNELKQAAAAAPAAPREPDPKLAEREAELARREQALAERLRSLETRERALARRAAELSALEARPREPEAAPPPPPPTPPVAAPEPPAPAPVAAPVPAPAAPAATEAPGEGWRLTELERLVEAHAADHPDQIDEWNSYLFYLRDYTDAQGRISQQFDWLIEDTFGPLLAVRT